MNFHLIGTKFRGSKFGIFRNCKKIVKLKTRENKSLANLIPNKENKKQN